MTGPGALLIDTGTTLFEARAIAEDVPDIANLEVSHIVLTHNHFDHILGSSALDGAEIYCAAEVATTMAERTEHLRADAVRYGADAAEVDRAIAALRAPEHRVTSAVVDLGDRSVGQPSGPWTHKPRLDRRRHRLRQARGVLR
jgi:glyoxylase-like metal-dependent hydrolase (beta-lactamase superfamily II)